MPLLRLKTKRPFTLSIIFNKESAKADAINDNIIIKLNITAQIFSGMANYMIFESRIN